MEGGGFRALRARGVRGSENTNPKFWREDFKEVCKSLCAFAPPARAHAPIIAVLRRYYKTAMIAPVKCATIKVQSI